MERKRLVIQINKDKCIECGKCGKICSKNKHPKLCSGCGECVKMCPVNAIVLIKQTDNNKNHKTKNSKIHKTMRTHIFRFIGGFIVAVAGFSAITMLLWNALLPNIFGIACISFWQALGLLLLGRILFSGIGGGNFMRPGGMMHDKKRNFIREKWMKMTPEERRKIFSHHHRHGGFCDMKGFDENRREQENEQN